MTFKGLFAFIMFGSVIPYVFSSKFAIKAMRNCFGYPLYVIPFVGIAKWLGGIAILIPVFPRSKKWFYAGLLIELLGASYSILAIGATVLNNALKIVAIGLGILSYILYQKKIKFRFFGIKNRVLLNANLLYTSINFIGKNIKNELIN